MLSKDQTQCHHVAPLPVPASPFSDTTTKVIICYDKIVFKVVITSFEHLNVLLTIWCRGFAQNITEDFRIKLRF